MRLLYQHLIEGPYKNVFAAVQFMGTSSRAIRPLSQVKRIDNWSSLMRIECDAIVCAALLSLVQCILDLWWSLSVETGLGWIIATM